jgi:radical SAM superfamily enzyme YgiQ (UPF0313 family)
MPHVVFVPFTGFRIREEEMLELGMTLPGLRHRAAAVAQLPALGLLTLAGMTPDHWSCSYFDAEVADEALVDKIVAERPALVAISALTASIGEAYRLSSALRSRGIRVVMGGLHVTTCPAEAIKYCDAIVVGEGEPVWPQVLADAEADALRPRYQASSPFDLSQSPVPRFELLGRQPRPRLTIQTERGCPLACEFCGASRLLGPFRIKPIDNTRRELDAAARFAGDPILELADDNTFVNDHDPNPMLNALAASGVRYFTEVDWRIGERPDLLQNLAASGCVQVLIGIESLFFRYPGMGPKSAELRRMMNAIIAIQEAGVSVIGCFIVGCDGETRQSLDCLTAFLIDCPLADVQLTIQTPFPGTALYQRLRRRNRLMANRYWSYYTLFDVTYEPDCLTAAELESAFRITVQDVFSESATARRAAIRRSIWRNNPRMTS